MAVSTWKLKAQSGQGRAFKSLREQIKREQDREQKLGWASLLAPLGTAALATVASPFLAAALPSLAAGGAYGGLGALMGTGLKALSTSALDKNLKAFGRHNIRGVGGRPESIQLAGGYGMGAAKRARESLSSAISKQDKDRLSQTLLSTLAADITAGAYKPLTSGLKDIGKGITPEHLQAKYFPELYDSDLLYGPVLGKTPSLNLGELDAFSDMTFLDKYLQQLEKPDTLRYNRNIMQGFTR